jgi:hypothetical protein
MTRPGLKGDTQAKEMEGPLRHNLEGRVQKTPGDGNVRMELLYVIYSTTF